ncbi:MAG: hypothetical protein L6R37_006418 [Teloschistes peruensis]|nr:MAG: hypothetical protein L6R37_006418 [Teloschistes peruensis]
MAPLNQVPAWYPLRSVTQRVALTSVEQLPRIAPSLALTISTCGGLLAEVNGQSHNKNQSDAAVLIHKLKTQLSTLLQDKSREARWSAVVLVKAIIEAGGWSILKESEKWVRPLIGLIGRPEPATTKKLSILTLTRIFLLTQEHPTLIREITTPSLPTFIANCLRSFSDGKAGYSDSLLSSVLWAFGELLPHHPSAFRPFVGQIRKLVLPLLAPTPSDLPLDDATSDPTGHSVSETTIQRAQQVFVLVNGCAPKNAQSQEWAQTFSVLLEQTHETADLVLRALLEDWEPPVQQGRPRVAKTSDFSALLRSSLDESGLPHWAGVDAGLERLNGLLLALKSYLLHSNTSPFTIPIGKLLDVVDRITSALPPTAGGPQEPSVGTATNPEISREERESVWISLPRLHVSALKILEQLAERLGYESTAINKQILSLVFWVFEKEHSHVQIRHVTYRILTQLLPRSGSGMSRSEIASLVTVLHRTCDDLLPAQADVSLTKGIHNGSATTASKDTTNADAYLQIVRASSDGSATSTVTRSVSESLLSAALHLFLNTLPFAVRSKIDKTAILAQLKVVQQSSVLNPPASGHGRSQSSVMPLLARQYPHSIGTEALIRPRMTLIQPSGITHSLDAYPEPDERDGLVSGPAFHPFDSFDLRVEKSQISPDRDKQEQSPIEIDEAERRQETPNPLQNEAVKVIPSGIPSKRPLELDVEALGPHSLDQLVDSENPAEQPLSKRIRDDPQDAYIVSTAESSLPDPVTAFGTMETNPPPADATASTESSASLGLHLGRSEDDDSDYSSIPAIDPTMDTEDEDEADEDE